MFSDLVISGEVIGEGVVTEIPAEVWTLLGNLREARLRWNHRIGRDVMGAEAFDAEVRRVEQIKARQEAFFTKYIDAGGIAIIADAHVDDRYLHEARRVVLVMTSKFPALRERLQSRHGKFYLVLHTGEVLPEDRLSVNQLGTCTAEVYRKQVGSCSALLGIFPFELRTFVHEFAHALESEIEFLRHGFRERLDQAYNTARTRDLWVRNLQFRQGSREYWAEGAEMWFYDIGAGRRFESYEAFFARDPALAELLDEWFPRVSF